MTENDLNYVVKEDGTRVQRTQIGYENTSNGTIEAAYHPLRRHFECRVAIFDKDLPRWLQMDGVPDLVEGKGSPVLVFINTSLMKSMGMEAGRLLSAKMCNVLDLETVLDIEAICQRFMAEQKVPDLEIDRDLIGMMIKATIFYNQASNCFIQSGHEILKIEVTGGERIAVEKLLDQESTTGIDLAHDLTTDEREEMIEKFGLEYSDKVWTGFDLNFSLEKFED